MNKKIGMIVAVEISAAIKKYKSKEVIKHGFRILETKVNNYELIIVNSTIGEIAAAAATELLISEYNVDLVVNFGLVGGLTETMSQTKLCIVDKVVHYDFDTSQIDPVKPGQYCGYPSEYIELNKDIINTCLKSYPNLKKDEKPKEDKKPKEPKKGEKPEKPESEQEPEEEEENEEPEKEEPKKKDEKPDKKGEDKKPKEPKIVAEKPVEMDERISFYQEAGISEKEIDMLSSSLRASSLLDEVVSMGCDAKDSAAWILTDCAGILRKNGKTLDDIEVSANDLSTIMKMVSDGKINRSSGKLALTAVIEEGVDPVAYIRENGFDRQIDASDIDAVVDKVLSENQKAIDDYKSGKTKAFQALFGACMKELKGAGNHAMIKELLEQKLK